MCGGGGWWSGSLKESSSLITPRSQACSTGPGPLVTGVQPRGLQCQGVDIVDAPDRRMHNITPVSPRINRTEQFKPPLCSLALWVFILRPGSGRETVSSYSVISPRSLSDRKPCHAGIIAHLEIVPDSQSVTPQRPP